MIEGNRIKFGCSKSYINNCSRRKANGSIENIFGRGNYR